MTIRIGSNTLSLNAQRQLARTTASLSATYEKLSSGQRINKASDDAAGLSIAQSLETDSRVFTQAIRNVNDGLSLLNIGDAAIAELSNVVIRIRELAEQSANGTYTAVQRGAMDDEAQALSKEFFRISRSVNFNGLRLFDGTLQAGIRLQAGYGIDGSVQSDLGGKLGTGSFGAKVTYATETGLISSMSQALALGDLNGDGVLDLVSAGLSEGPAGYQGQVSIRLGCGDGSFGDRITYAAETGSVSAATYCLTLGDLNGDGILDLVTAGGADDGSGYQAQTNVRLGLGDGRFGSKVSYATETGGGNSNAVCLGDVNNDGYIDLVTAGRSWATSNYQGQATVLYGGGDGSFGSRTTYAMDRGSVTGSSEGLGLADFNADGILDLLTAGTITEGPTSYGQACVRLGRGDGTFGNRATFATDTGAGNGATRAVSLGDLNGDGIMDLVTAGDVAGQAEASVLIGRGNGTFGGRATFAIGGSYGRAVTLADLNGDGILDLAAAGNAAGQGQVSVLLGRGDGYFGARTSYATETGSISGGSRAVQTGDVNGDGVSDLVTAGYGRSGVNRARASVLTGFSRDGVSPILPFSLSTMADARQAMGMLDRKLDSLSIQRGVMGAFQSRLQAAANNLAVSRENFQSAGGRIKDTDVAAESSHLVRTQILQQASSAVLAQANQQPALAIQLLKA